VFDLGGLQQALAGAGISARVITVATNPATYTGPPVAVNPANRVTVSGCFYQAMPAGSVLLIQGAAIGGQGPRAAADVSELASFPAPAVLAAGSLPPSCTWSVIATFPFTLLSQKPTS
jgi:hypothetical protein